MFWGHRWSRSMGCAEAGAGEGISRAPTIHSDEVVVNGIACGGTARGHADLAKDRREMGVDGAGANYQLFRHLLIGHSLSHQAQHLYLACGQADAGIGMDIVTGPCAVRACSAVMPRPSASAA